MRPLTPFMHEEICRKTGELLDEIGHTVFANTYSRVGTAELSKYRDPGEPRTMPIDILATAEIVAGSPIVSRFVLGLQGFDLVTKTTIEPMRVATDADVVAATKEFGDVVAAWAIANADGKRDALDRMNIKREINDVIVKLLQFERGL